MQSILLASGIVLVLLIHGGNAIRCFECNSHENAECANDIPPDKYYKNCDDYKGIHNYTFCRKIKQVIEFSVNSLPPDTRTIRGCGYDDSNYKGRCYQRSGFGGRQEVCACYEDYCNGASATKATFGVLLSALLIYIARFY